MLNSNLHYIAFLRGIKVGGHALITMADHHILQVHQI
jgi:uncharacterized protein (DUF1697 family)